MFDGNIITFNPGWDQDAQALESYDDLRSIQQSLKADGLSALSYLTNGTIKSKIIYVD